MTTVNEIPEVIQTGLEARLTKTFKKRRKVKSFWVSSSQVGGCKRQTYYDSVDPIQDGDREGRILAIILKGRVLHEIVQDVIQGELGDKAKAEKLFKDTKARLSGSIDNVIRFGDSTLVIDYKTKGTKQFEYVVRQGASIQDTMQVQAYMIHINATHGMLVYIDRDKFFDDGEVVLHWVKVPRGDDIVNAWLDEVEQAWKDKNPPPIPEFYSRNKPPCSWCLYNERCYGANLDEKEIEKVIEVSVTEEQAADLVGGPQKKKEKVQYGW